MIFTKSRSISFVRRGVYDSEIDGQYGPGTRKAITEWQIKNAMKQQALTISQQSELIKNYLKPLLEMV